MKEELTGNPVGSLVYSVYAEDGGFNEDVVCRNFRHVTGDEA